MAAVSEGLVETDHFKLPALVAAADFFFCGETADEANRGFVHNTSNLQPFHPQPPSHNHRPQCHDHSPRKQRLVRSSRSSERSELRRLPEAKPQPHPSQHRQPLLGGGGLFLSAGADAGAGSDISDGLLEEAAAARLVERLERITGEQKPAEAIISFARCVNGSTPCAGPGRGAGSRLPSLHGSRSSLHDGAPSSFPISPPKGRRPWDPLRRQPVGVHVLQLAVGATGLEATPQPHGADGGDATSASCACSAREAVTAEGVRQRALAPSTSSPSCWSARGARPPRQSIAAPARVLPSTRFGTGGGSSRSSSSSTAAARFTRLLLNAQAQVDRFPSVRAYWEQTQAGSDDSGWDSVEESQARRVTQCAAACDFGRKEPCGGAGVRSRARDLSKARAGSAGPHDDMAGAGERDELWSPITSEADSLAPLAFIPWTEAELRSVFNKFSHGDDREVRSEDLCRMLRYLGARPLEADVDEIVSEMTKYASLNFQEYMEFIRRYRELDVRQLRQQFEAADFDQNGLLDERELHMLLLESGYSPTGAVTREALQEIDKDGNGCIDFDEFEQLRDYLRKTRGFLKEEAAELKTIFERAAGGEEETDMLVDKVDMIFSYLGYSINRPTLDGFVSSIDKDGSGFLSFGELQQLVRWIQDYEFETMCSIIVGYTDGKAAKTVLAFLNKRGWRKRASQQTTTFEGPDSPQSQRPRYTTHVLDGNDAGDNLSWAPTHIDIQQLGAMLADLGYFASEEVIQELLAVNFEERQAKDSLTVTETFDFVRAYRRCEGYTAAQWADLQDTFQREQAVSAAGDNDETLDALELGRILRWFGISKTLQQVRRLIDEVDFDGSQQLEFHEFVKLMRRHAQGEARSRRQMFNFHRIAGTETIPVAVLPELLRILTSGPAELHMISAALARLSLDKHTVLARSEFEEFFRDYRSALTETVRQNQGYAPAEVQRLKAIFDSYDTARQGSLGDQQLRRLIEDHMPEAVMSMKGKEEMKAVLAELPPPSPLPPASPSIHLASAATPRDDADGFDGGGARADGDTWASAILRVGSPPSFAMIAMSSGGSHLDSRAEEVGHLNASTTDHAAATSAPVLAAAALAGLQGPPSSLVPSSAVAVSLSPSAFLSPLAPPSPPPPSLRSSRKAMKKVAARLEFHQFLAMMRKAYDLRDERDIVREEEAIKEGGYGADEVEAYRELFLSNVDSSGEMDLFTLLKFLSKIAEVDLVDAERLKTLMVELSPEQREVSRFPQFLRLMKRITEHNLLGINESVNQVLHRRGTTPRRSTLRTSQTKSSVTSFNVISRTVTQRTTPTLEPDPNVSAEVCSAMSSRSDARLAS